MKKIIDEYIRLTREYFQKDQSREIQEITSKQMRELETALYIGLGYDLTGLIHDIARYCEWADVDSEKVYECLAVMGYQV